MQDITPQLAKGTKKIDSYGAGGFKILGERFEGSIFVSPSQAFVLDIFDIDVIGNAEQDKILSAIENDVEILLVGYGKDSNFLEGGFEKKIRKLNVNVEYMDTGAAARTYNVLITEERKVAVVMIAV